MEDNRELKEKETETAEAEEKAVKKRDSDRLGTEPVHQLLLKMSAPLMVSMFVMALYNIVDSIFLGMYSTDALTAVSYCFPFQNLNAAFGIGTAVGMSALLSRYLGAKDYDRADKVAHNGFILVAINYTIFFVVGCFAPQIMSLMTSENTNAQIIADGTIYLRITQWLSFAPMIQSMFERLLQGTGKTKYIFYMQLAGTLFNTVVDPILIFGLFGLPRMGAKGAALATVFGQLLGCVLGHLFKCHRRPVLLFDGFLACLPLLLVHVVVVGGIILDEEFHMTLLVVVLPVVGVHNKILGTSSMLFILFPD